MELEVPFVSPLAVAVNVSVPAGPVMEHPGKVARPLEAVTVRLVHARVMLALVSAMVMLADEVTMFPLVSSTATTGAVAKVPALTVAWGTWVKTTLAALEFE